MPSDSEEDRSLFASKQGARLPNTSPAAPPPATPASFAWGVCGIRNEIVENGVERDTTGGVTYTAPPLPVVWAEVDGNPSRLRMAWPGNPNDARTLAALRRDLAAHRGTPPEKLLAELDAAARGLAALAVKLETADWSLGLASPDNLFLHPHGVVPVDLGFTWRGMHPNMPLDTAPGRPDWLKDPQPFETLWPHPTLHQQFAGPGQGGGGNVALVGRVLAWLVTGDVRQKLTGSGPGQPEPWAVLVDAVGGQIPSAEELQSRLARAPLRGCLAPPPPPPPVVLPQKLVEPPKSRGPLVAAVAVGVLLLGGLAVWQFTKDDPVTVEAVNKTDEKKDTRNEKKDEKNDKQEKKDNKDDKKPPPGTLAEAVAALKAKYDATPPGERAALAAVRTALLAKCEAAVVEAQTHAETAIRAGDVDRKDALARQLAAVAAALEQLATAHPAADAATKTKEQECFTFASILAVQLGARR